MAITITKVKVNNQVSDSSGSLIIPFESPIVTWEIETSTAAIKQLSYEIRVGTNNLNWGTSSFVSDIIRQPYARDAAQYWKIKNKFINRGDNYYCQIRVKDTTNEESEWVKFKFKINRLPFIIASSVAPLEPSEETDIELSVTANSSDSVIKVKWFRNGVHYRQFDNYQKISKEYLRYGDRWYAEVAPYDGIEMGPTVTIPSILITKKAPQVDTLQILPLNPNVDDILEASYVVNNPNTNTVLIEDKSKIKWYVNNQIISEANDKKFVRFLLKPNDEVYFTLTPSDGIFVGETVSSQTITIQESSFRITNLRIDGLTENLSINSVNPTIEWDVIQPFNKISRYANIRIGTAQGSNNTYETTIETYDNKFSIPDNIIRRGIDYYVSVAMSDTNDSFDERTTAHFRVAGNLWERDVSNSTGWTVELALSVEGEEGYQRMSLGDGSRFAEIRFYTDKIQLLLGSSIVLEYEIDMEVPHNILIVGKNNTIKVYAENSLVLDGTDLFEEQTTERFIEVGSNADSSVVGYFKRIAYNIDNYYEPGSSVYSSICLEKFISFTGMSVSDITQHEGNILVSTNPFNSSESGQIYKIIETEKPVLAATENIDVFDLNINSFGISPNNTSLYLAHTKGASFFSSYYIPKYDNNSIFNEGFNPKLDLWELVKTTSFVASSYVQDGLVIDTTISNREISVSLQNTTITTLASAISFVSFYDTVFSYNFDIEITSDEVLNLYLTETGSPFYSTSLADKSVSDLITEIKALNASENYFFASFYDVFSLNSVDNQAASRLQVTAKKNLFPNTEIKGTYQVIDPYNPNPYGTLSTGKWFYCHRKNGTPWFERVDNAKGWTIDFDFRVDSLEDSDTPSNIERPKGVGLYFNDGTCSENIWFLPQEIIFEGTNKIFVYDTTSMTNYRLIGKKTKLKLYGKKETEQSYGLIAETAIVTEATNQGNAGRPAVVTDAYGTIHTAWHDDGKGINRRQIYYSSYNSIDGWSAPELVVSDAFSSSNPDIAVDSLGNVYIVYETTRSDYTDISVIVKNSEGWSESYLLTSNLYDSFSPKVVIDIKNNVHVIWEDYRFTHSQIFYCRRNAANGQWESQMFGGQDIQITNEPVGAKRPAITYNNLNIYVSWTSFKINGSSGIKMALYDGGQHSWKSSGQGGLDFSVSGINEVKADSSDIIVDLKGQIVVVWNDVVNYNSQIFGRFINPRLVFAKDILQLTSGEYDSLHPKCGLDDSTGNIYVVFEKDQEKVTSAYDPYITRESDVSFNSPSVYLLRWNASYQVWESSNQYKPSSYDFSFDVKFDFGLPRESFRPIISDKFNGYLHILFESTVVTSVGEVISNENLFRQVRDIVYDYTFEPVYEVASHDAYGDGELQINGTALRKEIRFGDFSDNLACRLVIGGIKYYLSDSVEPFSISLISSATTNMPNVEVLSVAVNNNGDAWIGTKDGLLFYNKVSNQAYLLDSDSYNVKGLAVHGISFDKKNNMYLATESGTYVSSDHSYFFKLTGNLPVFVKSIDVDNSNQIYLASAEGVYIVDATSLYDKLTVNKTNAESVRTIEIADSDITTITFDGEVIKANVVKVDGNNVAWIGTDNGLIRYLFGDINLFTTVNGLNSNKVNDISIRNTAIRYLGTTAGVNKMTGISISPLNFDNTNAPPSSLTASEKGDINMPIFGNAKCVQWKDPNILWVASTHSIYQITFIEESFTTEKTEVTKFSSDDFTLSPVVRVRNNDLQTFRLVGLDNKVIPGSALFEVLLNGNRITRGYRFSPDKQLIRFDYPLSEVDIVKINVRFDVEKIGDFAQNKAKKIAIGTRSTTVDKLLSANGGIYAMTGGDVNTLHINDSTTDLPFDKIILDRTPPRGKISIGTRRERSVFETFISPLANDPYGIFDDTSGIDKMVVSNYENFTSDGETPLAPMVFSRFLLHNIGEVFDSVSRQYTFESGLGRRLLNYQPVGGSSVMMAGTAEPANIYKYNPITQLWEKIDTLDVIGGVANPNTSVEFMTQFQGKVYVGTGCVNGSGKLWVMNPQTFKFDLMRTLPSNTHAYCSVIFDDVLYIGGGGGSYGALYSYDGTTTQEVFTNISGAVYSLVESNRELYAATGYEGRIYKLDPRNLTQQIVDVNADRNAISIDKAVINGQGYVFAGFGNNGQVKRSKVPDGAFIHSFKTVASSVYAIKNIDDVLHACIGNTLYQLNNVWTAKYTHIENIRDVVGGENDISWFVSDSYVYKIGKAENVKKVYLKLIDKAGNETNLYTDTAQSVLDTNLFTEISISDLAGFINRNRIMRVDSVGNATDIREGNDRFYSGDVIDEEQGEYYSEIFNGTNNLVSWDRITWDATIPDNTSITIYVKTGATKDEILNKEFEFSVEGAEASSDISFFSGQYVQFKVVMKTRVRGLSPTLKNVVIRSISSDSTHFFTTNFVLPSKVKSGILTSTKILPVAADIVFGINTTNSTDFAEYQIVDENRIFTTEANQIGSDLRIGIRFITPTRAEAVTLDPDEYSPYGYPVMFNSVEWNYRNPVAAENTLNFKVGFYEDSALSILIHEADSADSVSGFSADGDIFATGGVTFDSSEAKAFSYTPIGTTSLRCNTYYYIKIEAYDSDNTYTVSDSLSFIESCGTTFVDNINFEFTNTGETTENVHFRIRFYNDPERTDHVYTAFSGNDILNWTINEEAVPVDGYPITSEGTIIVNYFPGLSNIEAGKTYYLSIDVYNGETFENNSNSFTFKANDLTSQIYCGSYSDVPVIKNFSVMFELENNEFISMRASN